MTAQQGWQRYLRAYLKSQRIDAIDPEWRATMRRAFMAGWKARTKSLPCKACKGMGHVYQTDEKLSTPRIRYLVAVPCAECLGTAVQLEVAS